jgi:hypothetical protein
MRGPAQKKTSISVVFSVNAALKVNVPVVDPHMYILKSKMSASSSHFINLKSSELSLKY